VFLGLGCMSIYGKEESPLLMSMRAPPYAALWSALILLRGTLKVAAMLTLVDTLSGGIDEYPTSRFIYYGKMDENSTDLNNLSAKLLFGEDDLCDLEQTEVRGKIVISAVPLTRMQCSVDDVYSRLDISGAAAFVYAPPLHPASPT